MACNIREDALSGAICSGEAVSEFLKMLAEWGADFWFLIVAPPIYAIWLTFLSGPAWTSRIQKWLESAIWSDAYVVTLIALSDVFDSAFGKKIFSLRSIFFSILIVLFYSLFYSMIIVSLSVDIFEEKVAIAMVALMAITFFIMIFLKDIFDAEIIRISDFRKMHWQDYGIAVNVLMNQYFAKAIPYLAVIAVPIILFSFGSSSLIYFPEFKRFDSFSFISSLFVIIANVYFDFLSWSATRWLIRRLTQDMLKSKDFHRLYAVGAHVFVDIIIALFSLIGLSALLSVVFSENLLWEATYSSPFSLIGSTLTIMLLSTLLPTFIHLFCAVFAILPILPVLHRRVARLMHYEDDFRKFEAGDKMIVAVWLTVWSIISAVVTWWVIKVGIWLFNFMWVSDPVSKNLWQTLMDYSMNIFRV